MKKSIFRESLFWGIGAILVAVAMILDSAGIFKVETYGLSIWKGILALLCLTWLIERIVRLKIADIFIPIGLIFILTEDLISNLIFHETRNLANNWIIMGAALLLTIGFHIILPKRVKKGSEGSFHIRGGKSLGNSTIYLDGADMSGSVISDRVGDVTVYVTNKDNYPGEGVIRVSDIVGRVTVHTPSEWLLKSHVNDNVGRIIIPEQTGDSYEKTLTLEITDVVGDIEVIFE